MKKTATLLFLATLLSAPFQAVATDVDGGELFKKKCSICHKIDKKGMGPAIMEMSADSAILKSIITDGRNAMPSFSNTLEAEQIDALVVYIQSKQTEAGQ